jgi:hypothetical protein
MAKAVYILCTLTSLACAVLLLRGYSRTRVKLLLWSGICFVGLTLNNLVLFLDLAILPTQIDLSLIRNIIALISLCILIFGLIWETD